MIMALFDSYWFLALCIVLSICLVVIYLLIGKAISKVFKIESKDATSYFIQAFLAIVIGFLSIKK